MEVESNKVDASTNPNSTTYFSTKGVNDLLSGYAKPVVFEQISANQTILANKIYYIAGSSPLDLTLPATWALNDLFFLFGNGNTFRILQNAGQQIVSVSSQTTVGSSGKATSTNQYCTITLRGISPTKLLITSINGIFTYD